MRTVEDQNFENEIASCWACSKILANYVLRLMIEMKAIVVQ